MSLGTSTSTCTSWLVVFHNSETTVPPNATTLSVTIGLTGPVTSISTFVLSVVLRHVGPEIPFAVVKSIEKEMGPSVASSRTVYSAR